MATSWNEFDYWNNALADGIFNDEVAGQPVYFEVSDDRLEKIGESLGVEAGSALSNLIEVVRNTLVLDRGPSSVLSKYWPRFDAWWDSENVDPPPVLPLLAVLVRTALNMQSSGDLSSSNFYGRFAELLGLSSEEQHDFQWAYGRKVEGRPASAWLWDGLNLWLEAWEGNRGLPTAYANNYLIHIGMPVSQALVRELDRTKLPTVFAAFGLAPKSSLDTLEMIELLDEWFVADDCSASVTLKRLWGVDDSTKERIAEVACSLLKNWDGSGVRDDALPQFERRLMGAIKIGLAVNHFPTRRYALSLLISQGGVAEVSGEIIDKRGNENQPVDLIQIAPGWLGLGGDVRVDFGSLLAAPLSIRLPDRKDPLERQPRRLIPLGKDEMLGGFVEVPRVTLGEDFLLLSQESLRFVTLDLLEKVARPGFAVASNPKGIPEGWILIEGVQILSSIPEGDLGKRRIELSVLQPIATSQASLEGGFKLPGNTVKYASFAPPELRVTRDGATSITATITCKRPLVSPKPADVTTKSEQPVLIWDLSGLYLGDGDYEITITDDTNNAPSIRNLRLRSADHPAISFGETPAQLGRRKKDPLSTLSASPCDAATYQVTPEATHPLDAELVIGSLVPPWFGARQVTPQAERSTRDLTFASAEPNSCIVTGGHVMQIETLRKGEKYMGGACKSCGLQRRYPLWPKASKIKKKGAKRLAPSINVHELAPTRPEEAQSFDEAFDALGHLRHGTNRMLELVIRQVENNSLFVDTIIRNLEMLGHIEVARDPHTLKVDAWSINPTTLLERPDGKFLVVGLRSESTKVALEDACYASNCEVTFKDLSLAPQKWLIETKDPLTAIEIAEVMSKQLHRQIKVHDRALDGLAHALPPLSTVASILPGSQLIDGRSIEQWDSQTARFRAAVDTAESGFYRLDSFTRNYVMRSDEDLKTMSSTLVDARLGKYLTAMREGISLIGYDEESSVLYAPLGAELPLLYARLAALAFGEPPKENLKEALIEYHSISPILAGTIHNLLSR